jgi:hypothetical protein
MKRNTILMLVLALFAATVLIAPVIAAADGGDGSLIHACVNKKDGTTRIVKPTEACKSNEYSLHWNSQHTILTPLGSDTVDLAQFPGTMRRITFEEGANLQLDTTDVQGGSSARYWFTFPGSEGAFTIQDGMLILEGPGSEGAKKLFFDWEGGEEGQYAGLLYDTSGGRLVFKLSPHPDERPVEAVTLTGSLLDASKVDVMGKIFRQSDKPNPEDLHTDAFAFWQDTDDGTVYLIVNIDGVVRTTPMQ